MKNKLITPPTKPVVTLDEVKDYLRLETDWVKEDSYLSNLISSATLFIESQCSRKLHTQTWQTYYSDWNSVENNSIQFGQLQSIEQISYLDEDGDSNIIPTTDYIVSGIGTDDGCVEFVDAVSMPTDLYQVDPIIVKYKCGYLTGGYWVASTSYITGDRLIVGDLGIVVECITAGTSHSLDLPVWPTDLDGEVTDGTVVWKATGYSIPGNLKHILLQIVAHYYENREPIKTSAETQSVAYTIGNILIPYRIW